MPIRNLVPLIIFLVGGMTGCMSPWKTNTIYSGVTGRPVAIYDLATESRTGLVLVVTVERGFKEHADNVERLVREVSVVANSPVSVGTDFLPRSSQNALDQYFAGRLLEEEFLPISGWVGTDFNLYRTALLFPRNYQGQALALGPSRSLLALIERDGVAALSPDDRAKYPPDFAGGIPADAERYRAAIGASQTPAAIERNLAAREYANDFTAYIVSEYMKFHPEQTLVVVTDDFFSAYSGGVVNRLRKRGVKVAVISQLNLSGLKRETEEKLIRPSPRFGPRADYIWIERR